MEQNNTISTDNNPLTPYQIETNSDKIGYFKYLGLTALFSIPFIGFICSILFSFIPKNKNIKSFSRAALTWLAISFVSLIIVASIAFSIITNTLASNNILKNTKSLNAFELSKSLISGDTEDVFLSILSSTVDQEYSKVFDELSKEENSHIVDNLKNKEYAKVLIAFKSEEFSEVINTLDPYIKEIIEQELITAANGRPSEEMEQIVSFLNHLK